MEIAEKSFYILAVCENVSRAAGSVHGLQQILDNRASSVEPSPIVKETPPPPTRIVLKLARVQYDACAVEQMTCVYGIILSFGVLSVRDGFFVVLDALLARVAEQNPHAGKTGFSVCLAACGVSEDELANWWHLLKRFRLQAELGRVNWDVVTDEDALRVHLKNEIRRMLVIDKLLSA